ncbi:MAG: winged helix-turn-helix domain-containing protein [Vicinamibacterales bacterium]
MLRFDQFTLDPETGELRDLKGASVPLEPQPARVLAVLASRPGALVSRAELRASVWPEGTHVEFDQGLNYCIRQVRAALGDNARRPVFIETVARRGYRFLPPVEGLPPVRARRAAIVAALAAGLPLGLWIAERAEGDSGGRVHHGAVVGILKAIHDLIF